MMRDNAGLNYGGLSKGKKNTPVLRGGIMGCIKKRILTDMFDAVPGDMKILICDKPGATIISNCLRVHELMEHGVTLVEDLFLERQPLVTCPAIYFIAPSEDSVRRLMMDWTLKKCYREAHVFFTAATPDRFVNTMAGLPLLAENIRTLKDMLLDFAVPEPLLFHLGIPGDLPKLFPAEIALAGGRDNILGQVATRLVSVFVTIGCGVPAVRYQGSSRLAQHVARGFYDEMSKFVKAAPELRAAGASAAETPLLIVVDRSFDPTEVLLHERTYQCLVDDLMPLPDGVYEQTVTSRGGDTSTKRFPIDEHDAYWCSYRHRPMSQCIVEFPQQLDALLKANPSLAAGLQNTIGVDANRLAALGGAVRALPEFQEKQTKLSLHIDMCTKVMDIYRAQKLPEVCEVEQDIAAERKPFKELYEAVRRLAGDVSVPTTVRVRLVLLLFATCNTREMTEAKKQQLLQESGLSSEAARAASIGMFTAGRVGRLKPAPSEGSSPKGAGGSGGDKPGTSLTSLRRTLRRSRTDSPGASATSAPGGAQPPQQQDPYQSQALLVLQAAVSDSLSTSDFPAVNAALTSTGAQQMAAGGATQRRTLRAGLARNGGARDAAGGAGGGGGTALGGGGVPDNATLDLGNEGQFPLKRAQKVVLFVLGGCTYGEARAAYTVAKEHGAEVIVGGTSMLRPEVFVTQLASL